MNEPATLADLVDLALQRTGASSARQLDRIAKQRGYRLTHTSINSMRAGTYVSTPSRETCDAFVDLTGLSAAKVYAIAGTRVPGDPIEPLLPPETDLMDLNQKRVAVEVMRGFVRDQKRILDLEQENAELKKRLAQYEPTDSADAAPSPASAGTRHLAAAPEPQQKTDPSSLPGWHDDDLDLPDDVEDLGFAADRGAELDDSDEQSGSGGSA